MGGAAAPGDRQRATGPCPWPRIEAPHAFYIVARSGAPAKALLLRDWLVASARAA
ncbi:hypothetical protein ACFSHQ_22600 [Gemmobacter lanyuensis]